MCFSSNLCVCCFCENYEYRCLVLWIHRKLVIRKIRVTCGCPVKTPFKMEPASCSQGTEIEMVPNSDICSPFPPCHSHPVLHSPLIASGAHNMTKQTSYCHIKLWQHWDMEPLCVYPPAPACKHTSFLACMISNNKRDTREKSVIHITKICDFLVDIWQIKGGDGINLKKQI